MTIHSRTTRDTDKPYLVIFLKNILEFLGILLPGNGGCFVASRIISVNDTRFSRPKPGCTSLISQTKNCYRATVAASGYQGVIPLKMRVSVGRARSRFTFSCLKTDDYITFIKSSHQNQVQKTHELRTCLGQGEPNIESEPFGFEYDFKTQTESIER